MSMEAPWTIRVVAAMAIVGTFVGACDPEGTGRRNPALIDSYIPKSALEVGPILMSVDNATPWDEISGTLEPNFKVNSGDDFLNAVFPATALIQDQILSAFGFSAGIGLPQSLSDLVQKSKSQSTRQSATDAAGKTTDTSTATTTESSEETKTRKPGQAPSAPTGTPAGGAFPTAPTTGASLGIDPFIKYQAAASLFQAVRLLNAEIRNAALRSGYLPYLVRLKLAPMPYRPDLDVDVYAKIAFFHAHRGEGTPPVLKEEQSIKKRAKSGTPTQIRLPYILPLLVTDNMERAVQARAAEIARQFGLAINFMISNIGGNVGINDQNRRGQTFTASDFNSLMTVTRLSDNTLFVRLGAMNQAPSGRAMQARTYDISLLLLVPREYWPDRAAAGNGNFHPKLSVITQIELRGGNDGSLIGADADIKTADDAFLGKADAAIARFLQRAVSSAAADKWNRKDAAQKRQVAETLRADVQSSNFENFFSTLWKLASDENPAGTKPEIVQFESYAKSVWALVNEAHTGTGLRSGSVELRNIEMPNVEDQLVLLRDDGDTTLATLRFASNFAPGRVAAFLDLVPKGKTRAEAIPIPAGAIVADAPVKTVRFEFPSLAMLGLGDFNSAESALRLRATGCPHPPACDFGTKTIFRESGEAQPLRVVYQQIKPPKASPGVRVRTSTQKVVATSGQTSIALFFDHIRDEEITVAIDGADLKEIEQPAGLSAKQNSFVIKKDTDVRLKIGQLSNGQKFKVKISGKRSGVVTGDTEVEFVVADAK